MELGNELDSMGYGTDDLPAARLDRAVGCLAGQLAGDSLGGLVEFQTAEQIRRAYPDGVRDLADGGTWNTIAGQPTDDSEMALALARSLVRNGDFVHDDVRRAYVDWMNSGPFDMGNTTSSGLLGRHRHDSQANGAMMRVSPLGIFGAGRPLGHVSGWAASDAMITHPNLVCVQANRLFAMAIARAVDEGPSPMALYREIIDWALTIDVGPVLIDTIRDAAVAPPADYVHNQGWVLIAFKNALWQLLHAESPEDAIIDTVMRGGDTDTNAAICGALLGAVHGARSIPARWLDALLSCRPATGTPGVRHPRPPTYWPADFEELAGALVGPKPGTG